MKAHCLVSLAAAAALTWSLGASVAAAQGAAPEVPQAVSIKPVMAEPVAAKPSQRASRPSSGKKVAADSVHVYLLRGLLNVFSLGMDELADKIRAQGIQASVHNHTEWEELANQIAANYKAGNHAPIILVGHSLGADSVVYMADYLGNRGVPVALVIPFDGTRTLYASANVARMLNFTQRDYAYARRGAGFHGELQNMDMSSSGVDHLNIDKSERLHAIALAKIVSVVKKGEVPAEFAAAPEEKTKPAPKPSEVTHHGPKAIVDVGLRPANDETDKPEAAPAAATPASAPAPAVAVAAPVAKPATATDAPAPQPASSAPAPALAPPPAPKPVSAPAASPNDRLEYEKLVLPKR